jgi:hypothetical protein
MKEGLLWFDDDPRRQIDEKVQQAAARYRQKFGSAPDVCYVSEQTLASALRSGASAGVLDRDEMRVGDLRILPASTVRPHHFWIGRAG